MFLVNYANTLITHDELVLVTVKDLGVDPQTFLVASDFAWEAANSERNNRRSAKLFSLVIRVKPLDHLVGIYCLSETLL